ncbi:MAG: hypothetical protein NTZ73_04215 [Candidatus Diapherotrites archaeon]|nr:hypothetical protein [Candidatus Diapherotrites archaeon]
MPARKPAKKINKMNLKEKAAYERRVLKGMRRRISARNKATGRAYPAKFKSFGDYYNYKIALKLGREKIGQLVSRKISDYRYQGLAQPERRIYDAFHADLRATRPVFNEKLRRMIFGELGVTERGLTKVRTVSLRREAKGSMTDYYKGISPSPAKIKAMLKMTPKQRAARSKLLKRLGFDFSKSLNYVDLWTMPEKQLRELHNLLVKELGIRGAQDRARILYKAGMGTIDLYSKRAWRMDRLASIAKTPKFREYLHEKSFRSKRGRAILNSLYGLKQAYQTNPGLLIVPTGEIIANVELLASRGQDPLKRKIYLMMGNTKLKHKISMFEKRGFAVPWDKLMLSDKELKKIYQGELMRSKKAKRKVQEIENAAWEG